MMQIYGPGVEKLKVDVRPFKFKSSEVEVTFLSSNYHIELNPSDVGPYRDRDVAQEVIKEIAQSHAPSTAAGGLFKVIVLNEVDKMSVDGQVSSDQTVTHLL
jgi:replication factor C subunit 3/5